MEQQLPLSEITDRIFSGFPSLGRDADDSLDAVPAIGLRALGSDGRILRDEFDRVRVPISRRLRENQVQQHDILVTVRGSLAKTVLIAEEFASPTYASGNIAVIRPNVARIDPRYLWAWTQAIFVDQVELLRRGSTGQLGVTIDDLRNLLVPLPPPAEQRRVAEAAEKMLHFRYAQQEVMEAGERTFRALLQNTFGSYAP